MKTPPFYFADDHPLGQRERRIGTKQLAQYLGVSIRTIVNYRVKGLIPFWKINPRLIRYELSAVETALGKSPNELAAMRRRRQIWKQKNAVA